MAVRAKESPKNFRSRLTSGISERTEGKARCTAALRVRVSGVGDEKAEKLLVYMRSPLTDAATIADGSLGSEVASPFAACSE